jgi:hypothetical protein
MAAVIRHLRVRVGSVKPIKYIGDDFVIWAGGTANDKNVIVEIDSTNTIREVHSRSHLTYRKTLNMSLALNGDVPPVSGSSSGPIFRIDCWTRAEVR